MDIDENTFFRQATLRICGNLDFEIALQECLLYLKTFMPADIINLNLYDPGLTALKTIAVATPSKARRTNIILPVTETGRKFLDDPDLPPARIINNPLTDPVAKRFVKSIGFTNHSSLIMYLAVKGQKIGNVVLFAKGHDRYREEHLRLFLTLNEPFAIAVSNTLRFDQLNQLKELMADDIRYLHRRLQRFPGEEIIGGDFGLKGTMEMVWEVAPLDSPVVLLGETGVGKELIANALHALSNRASGPFIPINCGAIPETLIDSELFGHDKGAFTGAVSQKRGCFERAHGGTIFLDEVAELPPQAQVKMLRVLQEGEVCRVGGTDLIRIDIRVISATSRNLQNMVKKGLFREDLWFRLHVFPIIIPPLRKRKEDIPALVNYFLEEKAKEMGLNAIPSVAPGAMVSLINYSWPGNVRELANVVERSLILNKNRPITFDSSFWSNKENENLDDTEELQEHFNLDHIITDHIKKVLQKTNGKISGPGGAAELLGVNHGTLRSRLKKLGISYGRSR